MDLLFEVKLWKKGPACMMGASRKPYLGMEPYLFSMDKCNSPSGYVLATVLVLQVTPMASELTCLYTGMPLSVGASSKMLLGLEAATSEESSSTAVQQFTCLRGLNITPSSCHHFSIPVYLYLFYIIP